MRKTPTLRPWTTTMDYIKEGTSLKWTTAT